ncbi:ABC transporter substrate-binding protein [Microbacterium sp. HD4P20]|uniref:ABC transporter substrate-binding protein n=1 Tax=Microbacterium sp. HD4P20 TaxID=2864874 RepID=UPI001C64295E|nr:ABC transporter substrate-binding protein [Microbacterium sp. HD4P20]MCP2636141.1 ABC transporter substrate-binding protein [Microbacterium sp. HD4P20]
MERIGSAREARDRSRWYVAVGLSVVALTLGGCASGNAAEDGADSFTVALIEPDLTTVPLMEAVDQLNDDGYDIDIVELAEPELAIEGLAKGDYAISAEATSPALIAIEQGAPIRIIADVIGNQWAVYGAEGVESCEDLVDRPVGIFSEGAVATAMVKEWVAEECAEGEPDYLVIGGSDVRAQALLTGQIDATALEIADVVTLAETTDADFTTVVDFGMALPDLHPQTVYANADFLTDSPEAAQAFVDALIEIHTSINDDPAYLVELAVKHLGAEDDATQQEIAQAYVDAGLFDAAALTPENVQSTIDFFTEAGVVGDLKAEDVADLSFLP